MNTAKRQRPRTGAPIRNHILRALLESEYRDLRPRLEQVELKPGEIIYRADQAIKYVYFPGRAAVAMIDTLEDGRTVEIGIIGAEGMVGINIFLSCLITPDKAVVHVPGDAMRMKANDLRQAVRFGSPLQHLLLRYTQVLLASISQSVACSQHHALVQRVARLILTLRDHAESNEFTMSHRSIATLLGMRREGVSEAAGKLQAAGLITYSRAHIRILDAAGLKKQSCECYRFIRRQINGMQRDMPRVLAEPQRRGRRDAS